MQNAVQQREEHWYDTAIERAKVVSEALEVVKTWGAYIAEWILLICLIMNIVQMFPIVPEVIGNIVLIIQAISLDIAGFGLTSMGAHARRNGSHSAARKATGMGFALIGLMILTVILVTLPFIWPSTKNFVTGADKVMILLRVIVTVFYGHIVHSVRQENKAQAVQSANLEQELEELRVQLEAKNQEVEGVQSQLKSVQSGVSSLQDEVSSGQKLVSSLRVQLDAEQEKVSSLEELLSTGQGETGQIMRDLNVAKIQLDTLKLQLDTKNAEVDELKKALESGQDWRVDRVTKQLQAEHERVSSLEKELETEQKKVSSLRVQLENARVSSLQSGVSSGQKKVSSGQQMDASSGHEKVVQLDVNRVRKSVQPDQMEASIRKLLEENPGLSGRQIAAELGCSPTTASNWKKKIEEEKEEQSEQVVNG
jgi:transposase